VGSSSDTRFVDLNADLGEGPDEDGIYPLITSANIACGGHAGSLVSMAAAIDRCRAHGVAIGAHPSYQDVAGFGRSTPRPAPDPAELAGSIELQVALLASHARDRGGRLAHVKPHGALYNDAARDPEIARAVGTGVARAARDALLFGLAGSIAVSVWRHMGLRVVAEGFADRAYRSDGTLVPRGEQGAVLTDARTAAAHALELARSGVVETICVHGDTDGAIAILSAVRAALAGDGFALRAPSLRSAAGRRA
jgi:5-oxoprolinase (ATP-hydrolysing) subunit A